VEPADITTLAPGLVRGVTRRRRASDGALVRAAQGGSEAAVEELFSRHWPDAYRAAYLVTRDRGAAEDIAQEAFLAALRALPRFDRRRPLRP
jgi:RNA polymerase sigma-70 factor (ECF subfamily)